MWARIISVILGVWLMASPAVLGFRHVAADNAHITGPLIITFSVIAFWECTRNARMINLLAGAWLIVSPFVLDYDSALTLVNDIACGILIIPLTLVKHPRKNRFGGGWKSVWTSR